MNQRSLSQTVVDLYQFLYCQIHTSLIQVRRKSEMRRPADEGSSRQLQAAGTEGDGTPILEKDSVKDMGVTNL